MSMLRREDDVPISVNLREWSRAGPSEVSALRGRSLVGDAGLDRILESLKGRLEVRQGHDRLTFESTSYVGRVDVGPYRVAVTPKLPAMPLAQLLRYAYGLGDLSVADRTASHVGKLSFEDLLIALLCEEGDNLVYGGLARHYRVANENLSSPRGRILVNETARRGGVREAHLPCRHFERSVNTGLNQAVRGALTLASRLTRNHLLQQRVHRLERMLDDVAPMQRLALRDIELAISHLTRTEEHYRPALTLAGLLLDGLGVTFDAALRTTTTPGFLFDMNLFFQRLLSRFLHENLSGARIQDERAIRHLFAYSADARPVVRRPPNPRPDYALFEGRTLRAFLDAKYRDIWERGFHSSWLYQLSIYALASPSRVSILLYASTRTDAIDECIEIRQPLRFPSERPASVIMRPVPLTTMAALLRGDLIPDAVRRRQEFATDLAMLRPRSRKYAVA